MCRAILGGNCPCLRKLSLFLSVYLTPTFLSKCKFFDSIFGVLDYRQLLNRGRATGANLLRKPLRNLCGTTGIREYLFRETLKQRFLEKRWIINYPIRHASMRDAEIGSDQFLVTEKLVAAILKCRNTSSASSWSNQLNSLRKQSETESLTN